MDPILGLIFIGWWVTHMAKEIPFTVRGKTSPRMQLKMAKAKIRAQQGGRTPATSWARSGRHAARDFFAALWHDSWDGAHTTRQHLRTRRTDRRAAGTHWTQYAGRGTKKAARGAGIGIAAGSRKAWTAGRHTLATATNTAARPAGARGIGVLPFPVAAAATTGPSLISTPVSQAEGHSAAGQQDTRPADDQAATAPAGDQPAGTDTAAQAAAAEPRDGHPPDAVTTENPTTERNDDMSSNTAPTGETTNITTALDFAQAMAASAGEGATSTETALASLQDGEVTGRPIELLSSAHEQYTTLASTFTDLHKELSQHLAIGEAYAAVGNDAGSKDFNLPT